MEPIKTFDEMQQHFKQLPGNRRVVVPCPGDDHTAYVIERCLREGLADFHIVADEQGRETAARLKEAYPEHVTVHEASDKDDAACKAVKLVHDGEGDVLMKGNINTDNLLRAVLNKEFGILRQGSVMCHLTATECPTYSKMLLFSDAAVIPRPNLDQFDAMVRATTGVAHKIGIECPKVALIHFTEKTNPKFQHTLDYQVLKERAEAGEYGKALLGGPMDVKTACDAHSGELKGIASPVVGDADILIFPILEAANTFYKTMSLFGRSKMAGIIIGTTAPLVVSSRADSAEAKFNSLALACVIANG